MEAEKTFKDLLADWGNSVCGRDPERFIYDKLSYELQSLREQLAAKEKENAELIKANKLLTKKCAEYMMRLAGNPEI